MVLSSSVKLFNNFISLFLEANGFMNEKKKTVQGKKKWMAFKKPFIA